MALQVLLLAGCRESVEHDWPSTGYDGANSRYSPIEQITRSNVAELEIVWMFETGEKDAEGRARQIQATPIIVEGVLYSTTGNGKAFAINAATGAPIWIFDPEESRPGANRGVVFWSDGEDRRIFFSAGNRLYSLDSATGIPESSFGNGGWVSLDAALGPDRSPGGVTATSPGVVFEDLLIQGSRVSEGDDAAPGHIRAFDTRTGEVRWIFRTIPQPGEYGYETWPEEAWRTAGGANSWAGMALDVKRGIVFAPTGSATPDFFGGFRRGANLFANSLVALDARTGSLLWHYQMVHHDILDRDLPSPPNLLTIRRGPRTIDAVAQITKTGHVFVFDRTTGEPLFPIEEVPVPLSDVPGESSWPTQPLPTAPAPFARQRMTEEDLTTLSPEAHEAALARFRTLRVGGPFTPPSLDGSLVLPGFDGGGEWGGAAHDPDSGVLYVNASDVPWIATLVPVGPGEALDPPDASGEELYGTFCGSCHGSDLRGDGGHTPELRSVSSRMGLVDLIAVVEAGSGFMPPVVGLSERGRRVVAEFVLGETDTTRSDVGSRRNDGITVTRASPAPFRLMRYERWRDQQGYPAIRPPWGTLSAIDLATGDYLWRIPLGEFSELTARGVPATGTEQYGGPIVTSGGVLFIAATQDERIRAVDVRNGEVLWEHELPAAGYATPSTYIVNGRQFVVIAAGGSKLGSAAGNAYVAFALPR